MLSLCRTFVKHVTNLKGFPLGGRLQVNAQGGDFQDGGFQVHQAFLESGGAVAAAAGHFHDGAARNRQVAVKPLHARKEVKEDKVVQDGCAANKKLYIHTIVENAWEKKKKDESVEVEKAYVKV